MLLSACGGSEERVPSAAVTPPQSLDTQQVLVIAEARSETASPLVVNNGLLVLDDTSETALPIHINGM
jgi:hypothetical protein